MKTSWPNTDGTYPNVTAKNSTTGTSKDGTPLNKALVDEMFGSLQAIVYNGNITPSEVSEAYDNSDIVNSIMNIAGAPGEIVFKPNYDPQDAYAKGERLLQLIGFSVLVSSYPELTERVWCGEGPNNAAEAFFRCNSDDGSNRSSSGVYLKLPDYRGYFIRCIGTNLIDPDGLTRKQSEVQEDSIKAHSHFLTSSITGNSIGGSSFNFLAGSDPGLSLQPSGNVYANAFTSSGSNPDETRPINVGLTAYIRY